MDEFDVLKEEISNDVFIHASFSKVHDIDTINQRFQAELLIEARWHDSSLKSVHDYSAIEWKPEIYIENAINDLKEEVSYKIVVEKHTNLLMVSEIRKVKGLFYENLELESFPMDVQHLNVSITTKKSGKKINFIQLQPEQAKVKISNTLDKSAWYLNDLVRMSPETIAREYSFGKREYPALNLTCQAFRLPGFFYWNALLPILLISFAALGPFVIDFKSAPSRLPSTATMLLSAVSFKATVTRLLPTVSYLTSLDKYSLSSIVIIAIMFIYHSLFSALNHFLNESLAYFLDKFAFMCFFSFIVLMHVVYGLWLLGVYNYRQQLIANSEFHKSPSEKFQKGKIEKDSEKKNK